MRIPGPRIRALALVGAVFLAGYGKYYSRTRPFPIEGSTTELFLELTAGKKFAACGFLKTWLLPDYSISDDCRDRPVVYTHQPSGPAVLVGLLSRAGLTFPALRLPYALIAGLGLGAFMLFCEAVTGSALAAAAAGLYAVGSYGDFLQWSDHFIHSLFWLAYFGAMLSFVREGEGRLALAGRLFFVLLNLSCSIMWSVSILVSQLLFAVLLREKRFWDRLVQSILCAAVFTCLWFSRNTLYLGWEVAVKDIAYTITNRIWAVPARSELAEFYRTHGLVLWGVEFAQPELLSSWLGNALRDLRPYLTVLALAGALRARTLGLKSVAVKIFAVAVGMFCWYFIFLSLGQHYTLPYPVRTLAALIIAGSAAEFASCALSITRGLPSRFRRFGQGVAAFLALLLYITPVIDASDFLRETLKADPNARGRAQVFPGAMALAALPREASLWTNLDSPMLRHYTPATVVGSCTETAFLAGNIDRCYGTFYDEDSGTAARARKPGYYLISTRLLPGTLLCTGECLVRLAKDLAIKFRLVDSEGKTWWFFKLEPPQRTASNRKRR